MAERSYGPHWAQGPEWEGWEMYCDHMRKCLSTGKWVYAYANGIQRYELIADSVNISLTSIAALHKVANVIAEDRGGR